MDSDKGGITIEKLRDNNFHTWKKRIRFVLSFRELDDYLDDDSPATTSNEYASWCKKDKKAQAIIGLSLSDDHLEQVQHAETAKEMWKLICDIFEKHTLLNKLSARRRFYTASMNEGEKVLAFAARIRQLAATLKSMGVKIDDQEMAMAFLCGLPDRFDGLISALDALADDSKTFTFQFVVSRCQQEEQRHAQRDQDTAQKTETAALLAARTRPKGDCEHCGKHNDSSRCYFKYPHLAPPNHPARRRIKALVGQEAKQPQPAEEEPEVVCLNARTLERALPNGTTNWVIDSGCTSHLTYDRSAFSSYKATNQEYVDLGGNIHVSIIGQGDVTLELRVKGKVVKYIIKNVKHVPSLRYQLLSVSSMAKLGIRTTFKDTGAILTRKYDNRLVATGSLSVGGLYILDTESPKHSTDTALVASLGLWHQRLAHVSSAGIKSMADRGVVQGVNFSSTDTKDCIGCIVGKGHRTPIPKASPSRASQILELVHSDVLGPIEVPSVGGSRYVITFIDDHSNWTTVYTMHRKSESLDRFKKFKVDAERHTNKVLQKLHVHEFRNGTDDNVDDVKLKILRSDNGGEYLSNEFKTFLNEHGIKHELTVAYTPQQNGVAERMNRTLLDLVRSMLHHKGIEKRFWAEAIATAVYVRNRVTSRALPSNTTPHHLWHGKAPNLSHVRVFGAQCWYVVPNKKVKKLDARCKEAVMMGYSWQSKGYKLWDLESNKFVVSRDVKFMEESEGAQIEGETKMTTKHVTIDIEESNDFPRDVAINGQINTLDDEGSDDDNEDVIHSQSVQPSAPTGLRRSTRQSKPPGQWWKATPVSSSTATNLADLAAIALLAADGPNSYDEATSPDNIDFWAPGIKKEEDSIRENKTFTLVDRRPDMNVIPSRYVFRVKAGGPKVRIVAKGFRQVHGVDFTETYAPVVSLTTVRCFLAIVAHLDLECDQMDVVTAFLNGDLEEDIYMEVPAGFRDPNRPNLVCKLQKAIYGLKQASRQWYAKINSFLVDSLKFTNSAYEPCLYIKHDGNSIILIVLYVDDLLIAGNDRSMMNKVKDEFKKRFKMKDLGVANEFLGIRIIRNRTNRTMLITQSTYIDKILQRFGMSDAKTCSTPMELPSSKSTSVSMDHDELATDVPYRQAIGSLMYLVTGTRPDIAYAVGKLAQYCEQPLRSHWTAVKRVLRYIKGTHDRGLTYGIDKSLDAIGYCDSDWASCRETRKSTEGFVFLIGGGAVTWRSKKQTVVATSSCEAEYMAAYSGSKEAIWLSNLLAEMLGRNFASPIEVRIDNQGCIAIAKGSSINNRNKHIDIRYHFVRDAVSKDLVRLQYVSRHDQLADPLTKPLLRVLFEDLCSRMGLVCAVIAES